jgi:fibronectin type 3 domain-containing protein
MLKVSIRTSMRTIAAVTVLLSAALSFAAPPSAPANLEAVASFPGDLAITLRWTDTAQDETGFEIQRSIDPGFEVFETVGAINFANVDTFNDVGLAEDTLYFYRVVAFNADGASAPSNVAFDFTSFARPNQVSGLTGSFADGVTALSWTDNADNETRFEVERAEEGVDTSYSVIAVLPANATTYQDSTALDGASYSYRITPYRFDVAGGAPETVSIVTGPPISGPTSIKTRPTSKASIEITWKGRFNRATLLQIQRFNPDLGFWVTVGTVSARDGRFTDTGLARRTAYNYRLRAATDTAVSIFVTTVGTTR